MKLYFKITPQWEVLLPLKSVLDWNSLCLLYMLLNCFPPKNCIHLRKVKKYPYSFLSEKIDKRGRLSAQLLLQRLCFMYCLVHARHCHTSGTRTNDRCYMSSYLIRSRVTIIHFAIRSKEMDSTKRKYSVSPSCLLAYFSL